MDMREPGLASTGRLGKADSCRQAPMKNGGPD
jgi:hypothetical protein